MISKKDEKVNFLPRKNPKDGIIAIHRPEDGAERIRKVVTRSRHKATGKFPSQKMGRMMQWESIYELSAFRLLEASSEVIGYYEYPLAIKYQFNKKELMAYPNLLVVMDGKQELWDIKSHAESIRATYIAKTQFISTEMMRYGYAYKVVIAENLNTEPRYNNVLTLLKYGRTPVSCIDKERVRRIFESARVIEWGAIINGALGDSGRQIICRMVIEGVLLFDIKQKWTDITRFYWNAHFQKTIRGQSI